ncbi:hypothetical protein EVAR_71963_1 [Eumeta japonica]|uniref:Uncharacterized protein n=1 Tax=Eumeta variegata TaxID=151549 RepID=A0A4C1TH78_EUMVA|nr:hypothetical protein EVAR_71963_1 [Eumeta japonica]
MASFCPRPIFLRNAWSQADGAWSRQSRDVAAGMTPFISFRVYHIIDASLAVAREHSGCEDYFIRSKRSSEPSESKWSSPPKDTNIKESSVRCKPLEKEQDV